MIGSTVASLTVQRTVPVNAPYATAAADAVALLDFRFGPVKERVPVGAPETVPEPLPMPGHWIPLRLLAGDGEAWSGPYSASLLRQDTAEYRACGDLFSAALRVEVSQGTLAAATHKAYVELVTACRAAGYSHLARIWNHLPEIDGPAGSAAPRDAGYRAFCAGRAAALVELGLDAAELPAASALGGAPGTPLVVIVLASRRPVRHVENPRQVSAYRYPVHYAGVGPAFARATLLDDLLLVSGTAAIVGHESRFPGDVQAQFRCALDNVRLLLGRACALHGARAATELVARIYLRDPDHLDLIRAVLPRDLPGLGDAAILAAEICRRELLVEVEAVARLA